MLIIKWIIIFIYSIYALAPVFIDAESKKKITNYFKSWKKKEKNI